MRLAVIGSRDFNDYILLSMELDIIVQQNNINTIISGGARGADYLAKEYAINNNLMYKEFPADWNKFGSSAGFIRNKDIVDDCNYLVAFWDNKSKGTKHSIELAYHQNKLLKIIKYNGVENPEDLF